MASPTSTRMELAASVPSNTVLSRVNPPYCPLKHPHGTRRPRVSLTKNTARSAGDGTAFRWHAARNAAVTTRLAAKANMSRQHFIGLIEQGIGEDIHVHFV